MPIITYNNKDYHIPLSPDITIKFVERGCDLLTEWFLTSLEALSHPDNIPDFSWDDCGDIIIHKSYAVDESSPD